MNNRFNGGQYIVFTSLDDKITKAYNNKLLVDHVYRQRKTYATFLPELDSAGAKDTMYNWINIMRYSTLFTYRIATPNEVRRYKELKKPYDINDRGYLIDSMFDNLDKLESKLQEDV